MVCIEQTIEYKDLEYVIISDDYEIDSRRIRKSFCHAIFKSIIDKLPANCKSNEYFSPHILQDITNQYMGLNHTTVVWNHVGRYFPLCARRTTSRIERY